MAATQVAIALAAIATLALWPPAQGFLLLVPLTAAARHSAPDLVVNGGATLIARGPWPGSLVVHGSRDRLVAPRGLLILAAPAAICGVQGAIA